MRFRILEAKADIEKFRNAMGDELADRFFKFKDRLVGEEKDIYYWIKMGKEELEDRLNMLSTYKTRKQKEDSAREGAELIDENEFYKVYHITTFEAAQKYGEHTRWCITGSKSGWNQPEGTGEDYYWEDYTDNGIEFYFFIPKTKDNMKYAVAKYEDGSTDIFDEMDKEASIIKDSPSVEGVYSSEEIKIVSHMLVRYRSAEPVITVPNGVTRILKDAFRRLIYTKQIILPDSLVGIGSQAFIGCSNLEKLDIPDSVESIGDFAFAWCDSIKKLVLPKKLKEIPNQMFSNMDGLKEIWIPSGVEVIRKYAFLQHITESRHLEHIYFEGTEEQWNQLSRDINKRDFDGAEIHFNVSKESVN